MSTALALCLDKNFKCINRSCWQTRAHHALAPPNELTLFPGSCKGWAYGNIAGMKGFYGQG